MRENWIDAVSLKQFSHDFSVRHTMTCSANALTSPSVCVYFFAFFTFSQETKTPQTSVETFLQIGFFFFQIFDAIFQKPSPTSVIKINAFLPPNVKWLQLVSNLQTKGRLVVSESISHMYPLLVPLLDFPLDAPSGCPSCSSRKRSCPS